jgi:TRAP-type mannitol/chloroaromatic compound transport system substrate-binding protein
VHEPGPAAALTVNRKAFETLPGDLQEIVRRAAGDAPLCRDHRCGRRACVQGRS